MLKKFILFFLLGNIAATAQEHLPSGARSWGMGNTSVTHTDVWSVCNNQGAMAQVDKFTAGLYIENLYGLKELSRASVAMVVPLKTGNFGLGIQQFGAGAFNRQLVGLGYSKKLGKTISGGIRIDYLLTNQPDIYGNKSTVLFEGGLWYTPIKNLNIGIHTYNPNQVKWRNGSDDRIPGYAKLGISWQVSSQVLLAAEGVNDFKAGFRFRGGAEYKPAKAVTVRTGLETNPVSNSFGVSYEYKSLTFDFASAYHYVLGFSTRISVNFKLYKKEEGEKK